MYVSVEVTVIHICMPVLTYLHICMPVWICDIHKSMPVWMCDIHTYMGQIFLTRTFFIKNV